MKEFKTSVDRTGTTSTTVKIQCLRTILRGGALKEFDVIAGQVGSKNNTHLKQIKEVLLSYIFPISAINKQKRAMRRAMRKPQDLLLKIFSARLT